MTSRERILAVPAAALALILGMELPRAIARDWPGFPNTLAFDTWQGRTTPDNVSIGDATTTTANLNLGTTAAAGTQDGAINVNAGHGNLLHIKFQTDDEVQIGSAAHGGYVIAGPANENITIGASGTGTVNINPAGGTLLGGGGTFTKLLKGTATVTGASIAANTCSDTLTGATVTVTGAATGDACFLGAASCDGSGKFACECNVNATNSAIVRYCNISAASNTPAGGAVVVWVLH